jgi:hypothetical protein
MDLRENFALVQKVQLLQHAGLFQINFRNAGVGCVFYEGPRADDGAPLPDDWRARLRVHAYYPTLTAAVNAECQRLGLL